MAVSPPRICSIIFRTQLDKRLHPLCWRCPPNLTFPTDHRPRALQYLLGCQALSAVFQCRREDYKDKRPKLLSEVHIGDTRGTGHKTKQEISQLGIRKKSDHQKLDQSSTGCQRHWGISMSEVFPRPNFRQSLVKPHVNLVLTLLWGEGWIRWPPEVPSNLD